MSAKSFKMNLYNEVRKSLSLNSVPKMKRILALLSVICIVLAEEKLECDPWPSNLKPIRDCCNIPHHSNDLIQNICYTKCTEIKVDESSDCSVECYVNMTGLIVTKGSINKTAAKWIYESNALYERRWIKPISDGVDKCQFDSTGSLTQSLVKFYDCVDGFLSANCVNFLQNDECDQVVEHYESCRNIQTNCSFWPTHQMNPDICCQTPQLLPEILYSKCKTRCRQREFLLMKQIECMNNCTFIETGLITGDEIDFKVVNMMLIESAGNKSNIWEKPIRNAAESCKKSISGK